MKKKIISVFIAFVVCFTSLFSFNLVSVNASITDFVLPETNFYYGVNQQSIDNLIQSVYDNNSSVSSAGYSPDNSYYFLSYTNGIYYLYLVKVGNISLNNIYKVFIYPSSHSYPLAIFSEFLYLTGSGSQLVSSTAQLKQSIQSGNITTWGCADYGTNPYGYSRYIVVPFYYSSSDMAYGTSDNDRNWGTSFGTKYIPPFVRSDYTLYGLDLSINETSFYDWIIENNKLSELPSYITQSKLLSFIDFYSNFGGSFTNFLKNIPDWFNHMNIINQSSDNVNILKSSMDRLYQEYLDSFWREVGKGNSSLLPHHRKNIQTQTTDDDLTLITDDNSDTVDTSILRDILRGVIQLSNQVAYGTTSIVDKLDKLNFTVNVANSGGSFSASEIWGSGDITQSSNYQVLSDVFVQHGVVISNVENLQYNYLAGQNQKDSFTFSVDMPDKFVNGEFTKKTVTHTVNSDSKMYDTLIIFRKIIALAVILFYVVRLKLSLPSLIKGE